MPNPKAPRFLVDVRDEASGYLGRELTDSEWAEAYPPAAQKLSRTLIGEVPPVPQNPLL